MNGLENRINRHLRKEKKMHWHIDYLLASENAKIARVFVKENAHKARSALLQRKLLGLASQSGISAAGIACVRRIYSD